MKTYRAAHLPGMSTDANGHDHNGTGAGGGQFAVMARAEATGTTLELSAERMGGLVLEGHFTDGGRDLAAMISRSGLKGTVVDQLERPHGWSRVVVTLAHGGELHVGVAYEENPRYPTDLNISSFTTHFYPADDGLDLDDASGGGYGGFYRESDVHFAIRKPLMAAASRAGFEARFGDFTARGLSLEAIGLEQRRGGFFYDDSPRPEVPGARFSVDGAINVLLADASEDVPLELDADGVRLTQEDHRYRLALTAADVNARLGLTPMPGQSHPQALSSAVSEVVASAAVHPVWGGNFDESLAGPS
jgi:hypothetical protein